MLYEYFKMTPKIEYSVIDLQVPSFLIIKWKGFYISMNRKIIPLQHVLGQLKRRSRTVMIKKAPWNHLQDKGCESQSNIQIQHLAYFLCLEFLFFILSLDGSVSIIGTWSWKPWAVSLFLSSQAGDAFAHVQSQP